MKDNFSKQAEVYRKFRPEYPDSLYDFIYSHVNNFNSAWDCATGNGQVAKVLAKKFKSVKGTDISENQLKHAYQADNITYSKQPAEHTDFNDSEFDLITVAQSIHWFENDAFHKEIERVIKPGGIYTAWGYDLLKINSQADHLLQHLYEVMLKDFWDPERRIIDEHYASIKFPGEKIPFPDIEMKLEWNTEVLEGYLRSWSAVQHFIDKTGVNPVDGFMKQVRNVVPDGDFTVRFPVFGTMCRL